MCGMGKVFCIISNITQQQIKCNNALHNKDTHETSQKLICEYLQKFVAVMMLNRQAQLPVLTS